MNTLRFPKKLIYKNIDEASNMKFIAQAISLIIESKDFNVILLSENKLQIGLSNNFWLTSDNENYILTTNSWNDLQLSAIKTILEARNLC